MVIIRNVCMFLKNVQLIIVKIKSVLSDIKKATVHTFKIQYC